MAKKKEDDLTGLNSYLDLMFERVNDLNADSKELMKQVKSQDVVLQRSVNSLKADIDILKKRTADVMEILNHQKELIKEFSSEFKTLVKADFLLKLKGKVDEWGPENFITRNELKRNL